MSRFVRVSLLATLVLGCATAPTASPSPSTLPTEVPPTATPAVTLEPAPTTVVSPEPTSATTYAALDGRAADPAVANRLPLAVMIDDNVVARPQSGFNAASIVYQAPADGGEDRYMLVFQELDAPDIGPVRSGRPYFVYWATEYRAGFGHYGGDERTLQKVIPSVSGTVLYNLDAMFGSNAAYHRVRNRKAPHNGYTSTASLWSVAATKKYPAEMLESVELRPFKDDAPADVRPASGSITVPYNRGASSYAYDPATNSYLRSVAGKAQVDAADGQRVTARNVIVLTMRLSYDPESEPGHRRPVLDQVGSGAALVFRDGTVISGTWRKKDNSSLTRFYDASGTEISLNRGPIFIQVVATGTKVTYEAD